MEWWEKLKSYLNIKVLYPILRKLSKIVTAEIESNFFKEKFQVEVKRRCELEEEIIRSKEKHFQEVSKIVREAVRRAVSVSFEVIEEEYYLVPKKPMSLQDAFETHLGRSDNLLGKTPPID